MGKSEVGLVDQTKWNQKDKKSELCTKLVSQGRWSMLKEKKNSKSKFKGSQPEPTWKLVSGVTVQCTVFWRMEEYSPASTRGHGEWGNGLGEFGVRDDGNELFRLFWRSQFRLKKKKQRPKQNKQKNYLTPRPLKKSGVTAFSECHRAQAEWTEEVWGLFEETAIRQNYFQLLADRSHIWIHGQKWKLRSILLLNLSPLSPALKLPVKITAY